MRCPPVLDDEKTRLAALTAYGLSADQALPDLDPVVNIAARVFNMPVAAVNMIGADHVFFAASTGLSAEDLDMRRDVSFCGHAIAHDGVLVVPDATLDERFNQNPLVTGSAGIRFYAGVPLRSPQGHAIGALCVIDHKPHHDFSRDDEVRLRELAQMAADRLELRRVEVAAHQSPVGATTEPEGHDEEVEVHRLANTDTLTGLPNRLFIRRQTEKLLAGTGRAGVILLDLDGFKEVNNELGCLAGDHLLCEVAQRLLRVTATNGTVARVGGDEFVILLENEINHERAMSVARSAISALAGPISANGQEVRVTACCGVAIAPFHAVEALELISNADLALTRAKSIGRAQSFVFVPELRTEVRARRLNNIELDRALSDGEFVLFYQPQVLLSDGSLTGAEALIRWWHPQRGLLSPAAFLPALESGPLASSAGLWVLDQACAQAALWRRRGAENFRIGVNLFSIQLRVGDLVTDVMSALERHGLPPEALELEITENTAFERDTCALEALQRLRQYGVGVAFDDFGTGFASLSSLKRCPVSRLKIDRSFVQGMLGSKEDAAVVRAILGMARSFRVETVAEGVENEQQRKALWEMGCSEGQGYLFGRPLSAVQFDEIFRMGWQSLASQGNRAVPHDNDAQHHKTPSGTVSRS
ncbi:sensor domain-containing phosphodiesterase [Paraburkholderia azotifigens]|uniref:Sensor domain-containing phosphodiesterase n=1 Tax=Paraburkholderia azotifigens TaxID=2057004 RepID=A0A5C6V0M3_9BURK|nr:sensor domain-containing phosphodiesterase [Paraburkholderia azotifigens]